MLSVDPDLKASLYISLARENLTLKDWFTSQARAYIEESHQPELFGPRRGTGWAGENGVKERAARDDSPVD